MQHNDVYKNPTVLIGQPILLNSNPRTVQYAGYSAGTHGIVIDLSTKDEAREDDYCIQVKLEGFDHPECVKASHITIDDSRLNYTPMDLIL